MRQDSACLSFMILYRSPDCSPTAVITPSSLGSVRWTTGAQVALDLGDGSCRTASASWVRLTGSCGRLDAPVLLFVARGGGARVPLARGEGISPPAWASWVRFPGSCGRLGAPVVLSVARRGGPQTGRR